MELRGKVVVISGAGGGIGQALARRFAREGSRLALLDLEGSAAPDLAAALAAQGTEAGAWACDVRSDDACREAIAEVLARFGGVDVLVNNAGITHRSLLAETDMAVLRRVVEVNLLGAMSLTRAALESVVARRGTIVAVSSIAGVGPLVGRAAYAASKHGLHGFFNTVRSEIAASGARVLIVCPSYVETGIRDRALAGDGNPVRQPKSTVGRVMSPDEAADRIVRAVVAERREVAFPLEGRVSVWLCRFLPKLYERLMRASVRKEFPLI